jgi:murein DD-endopeptidase MepM/ murein hydrolase activator NlpD
MVHPGFAYYPYPDVDAYEDEVYEDDPYYLDSGEGQDYPIYEIAGLYDAPAYDDSLVYENGYGYDEAYDLYDDSLAYDPYAAWNEYIQEWGGTGSPRPVAGVVFVAVALVLFGLVSLLVNRGQTAVTTFTLPVQATAMPIAPGQPPISNPQPPPPPPADIFRAPYDSYVLTQGLHGYSYGHAAIDIKAGEGATIKSPIAGVVSASYLDGLGNTTLVIENDYYQVMFLHGLYTVAVGDLLEIGQAIGTESNQGNTVDWAGNSCRGRSCGHHTHLNVFDKRLGQNVNPLALIETFAGR